MAEPTSPLPQREASLAFSGRDEADLEALAKREANGDSKEARPRTADTGSIEDKDVVDWDGPDDPHNPLNWSSRSVLAHVMVVSTLTFISPLASSMFAPGVPLVLEEFNSTSVTLASFVVSVYILGYVAGPLVLAPLAELYGRLWVYHVCNILFVAFTVACAVAPTLPTLIGFRFLAGTVGACSITLAGGTVADLILPANRGKAMAGSAMGPLIGPVVGPIAGGFLAQAKGWRWVFWLIAILAGAGTIFTFLVMRETYSPVLLERKAARIRKTTNPNARSKYSTGQSPKVLFQVAIVRPMKLLLLSPLVLSLSLYMAVVYGYLYLLFTTFPEVFEGQYQFSTGIVGVSYLGIGVGMFTGLFGFGIISDRSIKAKLAEGEAIKPEYRLPPTIVGGIFLPISLFWYGWAADKQAHWIVPIIGTAFFGFGLIVIFMAIQTYLVDAFELYAASAIAANTVLRSVVGALLPLAGEAMYDKLGLGWGNSLLAFIALAMIPIPFYFVRYGEWLRTAARFQVKL